MECTDVFDHRATIRPQRGGFTQRLNCQLDFVLGNDGTILQRQSSRDYISRLFTGTELEHCCWWADHDAATGSGELDLVALMLDEVGY